MYNNILAIGAHVDDIEVGCLGTLLKFNHQGANIDVVISTDQDAPNASVRGVVHNEYKRSENLIGTKFTIMRNGRNDEGRPIINWNSSTIAAMDKIVNRKQYDLIITHSGGDYHQDHHNTFNVVNSSLRNYRGELWCMEIGQYGNKNRLFNPTVFVDISDLIEDKIRSIMCYESQIDDITIHNIRGLAAYRGQAMGVKYAEAFDLQYRNIL